MPLPHPSYGTDYPHPKVVSVAQLVERRSVAVSVTTPLGYRSGKPSWRAQTDPRRTAKNDWRSGLRHGPPTLNLRPKEKTVELSGQTVNVEVLARRLV
jgi:hypothetical protein